MPPWWPELCVACGRCVEVCPVKAKQVRNDTGRLRIILSENDVPVYVSLAPSWVNEFSGISAGQMIRALKLLGFAGVSETALGAQIVSADVARELNGGATNGRLRLSSACPTAVDFVCKYLPGTRVRNNSGRFSRNGSLPDAQKNVRRQY